MPIFVSGSLAYDRIMDFPGRFSDHILPDKIHVLNVSFAVNGLIEKFGGTAGNIAYSLALLGEKPLILATAGRDFDRYEGWLREHGLGTAGVVRIEGELTAGAYITTDKANCQITGFNCGAMKYSSGHSFDGVDPAGSIGIVAPGNLEDMIGYCLAYKKKNIRHIFDPGQQLPVLPKDRMPDLVTGADVLISNDYELDLILQMVGLKKPELLRRVGAVVTTLGENGSVVSTPEGETTIRAVKPVRVLDPTGAGDAYRSGLIKGLVGGLDLVTAARMGSTCASYAVEHLGTQEHVFTLPEFWARYEETYGPRP